MNGVPTSTHGVAWQMLLSTLRWKVRWGMSKVNFFAIPADIPDRAISFYQTGGLTRREFPGQPISLGIDVPELGAHTELVEKARRKTVAPKVAIPGVAWFAVCQDSEGNTFSIYQLDPAAGTPA